MTYKQKIRIENEAKVVQKIFEKKQTTRVMISEILGLNKATLSNIVQKLIKQNIIIEVGSGESTKSGGKKPILLEINKTAGYTITIELGSYYVLYSIAFLDGTIMKVVEQKNMTINKTNVFSIIKNILNNEEKNFSQSYYKLIGLCISVHGIVDNNTVSFSPFYDLADVDIVKELEKEFDFPIILENEANLTAIGEYAFEKNVRNFVTLSIHNGIGAGIIINGELFKGASSTAGEIGHTIIYPNGIKCNCGSNGCFEMYCSSSALVNDYEFKTQSSGSNLDEIINAYREGNLYAYDSIMNNCFLLAQGINNILRFISPECIIINAPLFNKLPELITNVIGFINKDLINNCKVLKSSLGKNAPLIGGTFVTIANFFGINGALKLL